MQEKTNKKYDMWGLFIKPVAVILGIVIGIFIVQAFFNLSDNVRWIIIGILSILWLIYYYLFEFRSGLPEKGEEIPDEF